MWCKIAFIQEEMERPKKTTIEREKNEKEASSECRNVSRGGQNAVHVLSGCNLSRVQSEGGQSFHLL